MSSGKENSSGKRFAKGGTTCLQCGDLGYDIALIFCDKCKEYAVHRYCLDRLPKTLAEDVVWCCDDCDPPRVEKLLYDEQPTSSMSEEKDFLDTKVMQPEEPKSKSKKRKSLDRLQKGRVQRKKKKKQQQCDEEKVAAVVAATKGETIGETREDLTSTAMSEEKDSLDTKVIKPVEPRSKSKKRKSFDRLQKGRVQRKKKKKQQQCDKEKVAAVVAATEGEALGETREDLTPAAMSEEKGSLDTKVIKPIEPKSKSKNRKSFDRLQKGRVQRKKKKKQQQCDKEKVAAVVAATEGEMIGETREDLTFTAMDEKLKESGGTTPIIADGDEEPKEKGGTTFNIIDEIPCTMEHDKGQINRCELDSVLEKERNTKEAVQPTKTSPAPAPVFLEVLCSPTEQARPCIDPVWRGSLSINNHAFSHVDQIVAHVSTLATSKVVEEAKLFPQLLCSDLYPRLSVWPKSFEKWGPTDDSIALFLFSEDEKNNKVFESLLFELIRGDFALKAVVKNAELLVFTSTKLPLHLWKFRGKFFLWGVFRAKQQPSDSSNAAVARSEDIAVKHANWRNSVTNPLSAR